MIGEILLIKNGDVKMSKFTYLEKTKIQSTKVVDYTMSQITINGESPVLSVSHAGNSNKRYLNALLARSGNLTKMGRKKVNADTLTEARERDIEIYSKYVIQGWDNVIDDSGKPCDFTVDNCQDFLSSIPEWVLDELRDFCSDPLSFSDNLDVDSVAKKS